MAELYQSKLNLTENERAQWQRAFKFLREVRKFTPKQAVAAVDMCVRIIRDLQKESEAAEKMAS